MLVKKSIRAGVALFLFVFFNMPYASCNIGPSGPVVFLTLEKTIAIAFLNNKNIQIQQREINVARANILEGWSRFFPKVSADTAYTYNDGSLNQDLIQPKYAKKDIGVFTGYRNDNKLVGIIKETLYDGGANVANLKQSELDLRVQDETLRAKKLDVEFEAKRLYYGLLLAHETEHVVRNFLRQAEAHYENVKNKHEQGTVSRFQLLQAKVRVSNVIPSLVEAVNAVELIKDDIKKLLSLGIWEQIEAEGRLAYSPIEVNELLFLEEANRNRPEIILSELGVNISKWSIELARSGYLPTITGDATYLFRSDYLNNIFTPKHSNWTVGGQVSFPVFDSMETKAKIDAARSRYDEAGLEEENVREWTAVNIRRACLDLIQTAALISSQEDNIVEAKEALRLSEIGYDNGVATNLEVLDAQVALSRAERNLFEGVYDYLMAEAFLARTIGRGYLVEETYSGQ